MSFIKKEFIDRLIDSVDIVDYIGRRHDVKKKGVNYFCRSPFSDDKTASFSINPVDQFFKCFSTGRSGNIITFIMELNRIDYREAVEELAKFKGWNVEYESSEYAKKHKEKIEKIKDLRPVLSSALKHYRDLLKTLPEDHIANQEIKKREYDADTIIDWQLGFAPGEKFIYNKCIESGVKEPAKEVGLISDNSDKFWNRLIYPIFDANDQLVGIAGRDLSGSENSAKWINPVDSEIYHKENIWFGLNRAKREIAKTGTAWIVEGYNDVIAWHRFGIVNTVAPCGTAISNSQIKIIKKIAHKVTLCMDADKAGLKSMLKHIPMFIEAGLSVEVCNLPDLDPDEFVRKYKEDIALKDLNKLVKSYISDGFKFFMEHHLQGSDTDKARGVKTISELISKVQDNFLRETYISWLGKESGFDKRIISSTIKEQEMERSRKNEENEQYLMPWGVTTPIEKLKPIIEKYRMFMSDNQIWMMSSFDGPPYTFHSVSNFSVEIIQHMNDEKFPKKLLRAVNTKKEERIFDVDSAQMNTPSKFDDVMTNQGNFFWQGNRDEHQRLKQYLFDNMGSGRKIDVLGWNPEGFFCWNNLVTVPGQSEVAIDENGVFNFNNISYYVPSANQIYKNSIWQYEAQKRVIVRGGEVTVTQYLAKMLEVHREHAITGILFTLASAFQDIVFNTIKSFPLLLLYGPPSSGKDQLANCCQSFFGYPQASINLESGSSTLKAQIREFAQFGNLISQLSEFKNGDPKLVGMLKGLWDRNGYKRGTLDSKVSTESVPILSSTILTGNEYPNDEALITRCLWEEMVKNDFSAKERKAYDELEDMTKKGVSKFMADLLHERGEFDLKFKEKQRFYKSELSNRLPMKDVPARIVTNLSVLGATFDVFKDKKDFLLPFGFNEMVLHFDQCVTQQVRKLNSASIITKFWDLFVAAMRGPRNNRIQNEHDFKLEGNKLFFNFTNVYNRIQLEWWPRYNESMPSKTMMAEAMKKEPFFIEHMQKGVRMANSATSPNTSAYVIDITKIDLQEELFYAIQWQRNEGTLFGDSPATPKNENSQDSQTQTLPF